MTGSQDGRLDLDDLGGVIDDAALLDDATETVGRGDDRPSLGQRLAVSGVGAWAARHRGLVRVGAVVAVVTAVAVVVREATAPPPPRTDVVATLAPDLTATENSISGAPGGLTTLTTVVLVSGERQGESVRVTGVQGPGIRTSTAEPVGVASQGVRRWAITAVLGCEGTDQVTTEDAPTPYSVGLSRTDAWGRVASTSVPAPTTDQDWDRLVGEVCWGEEAARAVEVSGLTARADTSRGIVTLGFDVTSRLGMPALVGLLADSSSSIEVGRSFLAPLEPGRVTQVDATLRVRSCDDVRPPLVMADARIGGSTALPGLPLLVQAARDDRIASVPYLLRGDELALVQGALGLVCRDAPRITATVVDAAPARSGVSGERGATTLGVRVRITSSSPGRAEVRLGWTDYGYATTPVSTSTTVQVGPAGTTVALSLAADCLATPPPPRLQVVLDVAGRTTPWSRVVDDAALEDALVAGCDGLTPEMLVTSGWPVRRT